MTRRALCVLAAFGWAAGCSDYDLSDGHDAGPGVGPDIVVEPVTVDFGTSPEHTATSRTVRIANRGTSTLHVERLTLGPSPVFTIPEPTVRYDVEPQQAVLQQVTYVATDAHDVSWLRVVSDDPDTPELDVPLTGGALVPELTIEPDPLSFGDLACPEVGAVSLHNTGGAPLTVTGALVTGEAFALDTVLALPQVVMPGAAIPVEITFEPGSAAELHLGQLLVDSDDPRGQRVGALDGQGIAPPGHLDTFEQVVTDWGKVDLMFFVDQSGSMSDDASNLGNNFDTFVDILLQVEVDYQVMAVTADDGCNVGGIITPATAGAAALFLSQTTGASGSYTEAGMIVTSRALDETDPGECNAGFVRPDVQTIAVMVSDEPEQSPGGWAGYLAAMQAKVPDVVITAVVGQPSSTCGAADGTGYHEAAAATGGSDLDLCDPDWGSYFTEILSVIDPPLTTFALSATPDPASLVVTVDQGPAVGWTYDPALNAVVFPGVAPPPPASEIEVAYVELADCP